MNQTYLKLNSKHLLFIISAFALLIVACEKEDTTPPVVDKCENTEYKYTTDMKTIFDTKCATSSCHNGNNSLADYSDYSGVYNDRFKLRDGIKVGLEALTNGRAQLTQDEEDKILCWVKDGAPE